MGCGCVSLRNINATIQIARVRVAEIAQGRKYGYSFRNLLLPKKIGNSTAGFDNTPPMIGPI